MKSLKRTMTVSLEKKVGKWCSVTRGLVNRKVLAITRTEGLLAHVEMLKEQLFRELVISRESAKLKEI